MTEQRIIDKARKLAALQKRAATAGEAAAAARQLSQLMQRHRIDAAQLDEEEEFRIGPLLFHGRTLAEWRLSLALALCHTYGVVAVHERVRTRPIVGRARTERGVRLYGTPDDMASVRYLYTWIAAECDRLCRRHCRGLGRVAAQSYREGFVHGVRAHLPSPRDAARTSDNPPHTSSLAVVETRGERALAHFRAHRATSGDVERVGSMPADPAAFLMGEARGRQLHLGHSLPTHNGEPNES